MIGFVLQFLLLIGFPVFAKRLSGQMQLSWFSPVLICYGLGILLANLPGIYLHNDLSTGVSQVSIVLAIPFLLFSTRLWLWIRYAGSAVFSFLLAVVAAALATSLTALAWPEKLESPEILAGMLASLYTGGTPNMQAVGLALKAPSEYIVLVNAADIVLGGSWLIFLISFSPRVMGILFRPFDFKDEVKNTKMPMQQPFQWKHIFLGALLSVGVSAGSAGLTWLIYGNLDQTALLLFFLTSLSLLASSFPTIRNLPGTLAAGEYLLLVFSLAIGMLADMSLLASSGLAIFLFCTSTKLGAILIHLILAWIFRIDRDTYLITSTSALYGPVFVPQIASVLKNKQLVFAGMATGLLGYAIGNYLGLSVAAYLSFFL